MNTEQSTSVASTDKGWIKRHPILTGIIVFFVIGIIGNAMSGQVVPPPSVNNVVSGDDTKEAETPEEAIQVTATNIIAEYKANEVSADATYKGKLVEVKGTVSAIAKDIMDTPYIALTNEEPYGFESVQCMFSKSQEAELAGVSKDQSITLRGRVSGKLGNVIVRECSIVK